MKHLLPVLILFAGAAEAQTNNSVCAQPIIKSVTPEIDPDGKLAIRAAGSFNGAAKSVKIACDTGELSYTGAQVSVSAYQGRDNGASPQVLRRKNGPRTVSVFFELPTAALKCAIVIVESQPDACILAERTTKAFPFEIDPAKIKGADVALQNGTTVLDKVETTDINALDSMTELELRQTTVANVLHPAVRPASGASGFIKGLTAADFQIFRIAADGKKSQLTLDKEDFSNDPSALSLALVLDASESMGDRMTGSQLRKRDAAERAAVTVLQAVLSTKSPSGHPSNAFVINFNDQNFINSANAEKGRIADKAHFLTDFEKLKLLVSLSALSGSSGSEETGSTRAHLTLEGGSRILDAVQRAALEFTAIRRKEAAAPPTEMKALIEKKDALLAQLPADAKALPPEVSSLMRQIRDASRRYSTVRPRPVIFLISDGEDNGSRVNIQKLKDQILGSGAALYMIAFMDPGQDPARNELVQLAYDTGGSALAITNYENGTSSSQQIVSYTREVVSALGAQYEMTFQEHVEDCSRVQVVARDFSYVKSRWQSEKHSYEVVNGLTLPVPKTTPLSLDPLTRQPVPSTKPSAPIKVSHVGGVIAWPDHGQSAGGVRIQGMEAPVFEHRIQVPPTQVPPFLEWEAYRQKHFSSAPLFKVDHRPAVGYCLSKDLEQFRRQQGTSR